MIRKFFRDSAIYVIPLIVSRGISFFIVPIYTRILSPGDYGVLDMLLVFGSFVNLSVALEISQGVARFYPGEKNLTTKKLYWSTAFWFSLGAYLFFGILFQVFSKSISFMLLGKAGLETSFRISTVFICVNGMFYLIQNQFRWDLRSKFFAFTSVLCAVVTVLASVVMAYFLQWGIDGILYGMLMGSLVASVFGLYHLRDSLQFRFHIGQLREMLKFSIPLVPSSIAVFISISVDRLMINHYMSLSDVGLYGMGYRVSSIVGLVMAGFQGALTPLIYTYYEDPDTPRQLSIIFRVFIAASLISILGLTIFAADILFIIATPAYYPAANVVGLLVPAMLLSSMYIFAPGVGIAKTTHMILLINIGGAIFHTFFNWLFVPRFGIMGAALSMFVTNAGIFSAYMVCSQRLYYVPHQWSKIYQAIAGTMFLIAIGKMVKLVLFWGPLIKIAIVLCSVVLFIKIGLITKEETSVLTNYFTRKAEVVNKK